MPSQIIHLPQAPQSIGNAIGEGLGNIAGAIIQRQQQQQQVDAMKQLDLIIADPTIPRERKLDAISQSKFSNPAILNQALQNYREFNPTVPDTPKEVVGQDAQGNITKAYKKDSELAGTNVTIKPVKEYINPTTMDIKTSIEGSQPAGYVMKDQYNTEVAANKEAAAEKSRALRDQIMMKQLDDTSKMAKASQASTNALMKILNGNNSRENEVAKLFSTFAEGSDKGSFSLNNGDTEQTKAEILGAIPALLEKHKNSISAAASEAQILYLNKKKELEAKAKPTDSAPTPEPSLWETVSKKIKGVVNGQTTNAPTPKATAPSVSKSTATPAAKADTFVTGKIYKDAKGNSAKYVGNGKWEEIK